MTETRSDVETLESLDWAPRCEARWMSCRGQNEAAYIASFSCACGDRLICIECVARKVACSPRKWWCDCVGLLTPECNWLDLVTLHPLGGRPAP